MSKYEVIIYWSTEDAAYVAEVPELPGCAAHGATQELLLDAGDQIVALRVDTILFLKQVAPRPAGSMFRAAQRTKLACCLTLRLPHASACV